MSFVFSKKRSRSATGESNSSFVKNVTSRVSGFLPATITKWFSSPSSSSANGSAPTADGTDSSTEDEAPESPSALQPPAKRLRYSTPTGKYSQLTTSETTLTSNVVTEPSSVLYSSIQSPPGRNTFRRDVNVISTPVRSYSDESAVEHPDKDSFKTQHTASAIGHSIAMKRKSIFDSPTAKEDSLNACAKSAATTMKEVKNPYFKPHMLGSPFYPGRTMYGGASASTTYINQPNVKQRRMTYVNESMNDETVSMSSSTRRVMDLLENYSSPLVDAKRIPRYELSDTKNFINSCNNEPSTRKAYKHQELYVPSMASIIQIKRKAQLMDSTKAARQIVASHSSTLSPYQPYATEPNRSQADNSGKCQSQSKLKSRLTRAHRGDDPFCMPETVELPTAVLQIDSDNLPKFSFGEAGASHSSTLSPYQPYATEPNRSQADNSGKCQSQSKLKSRLTRAHRGDDPFCMPETVELPTAVLQIDSDNLPKFSFGEAGASHSSTLSPYQPYATEPNRSQADNSGKCQSQSKLKSRLTRAHRGDDPFCMPETVELPTAVLQIDSDNLPKFSFGEAGSSSTVTANLKCSLTPTKTSSEIFKFSSPVPIAMEPQNETESPPPAFFPDRFSKNTSPSNLKLGNTKISVKVTPTSKNDESVNWNDTQENVITNTNANVSNSWKCSECWVSNKGEAQKCACCGFKQPVKQNESLSKCTVCKLANTQPNTDKCVNCDKMRTNNQFTQPITKVAEPSKWKCSDCWVENEKSTQKCICCGGRNPKMVTAETNKKGTVEKDWRCEDCLITNQPSAEKCAACGGSKPGSKPTAKLTSTRFLLSKDLDSKFAEVVQSQKSLWECRVCLTSNRADKSMCVCCDAEREVPNNNVAPKYKNFKFSTTPNPGYKFGIDPKDQETNISKKMDEEVPMQSETNNNIVPGIPSYTFTLPTKRLDEKAGSLKTNEAPKPSFSFGIPKQNAVQNLASTGFGPIKVPSSTKLPDLGNMADDKKGQPQEVPSISSKAEASFGTLGSPQTIKSNSKNLSALINNTTDKSKTETPGNPLISEPRPAIQPVELQFSFMAAKPNTGSLFSAPASTAVTTGGSLGGQTSTTATIASMPLFQKPEGGNPPSFFSESVSKKPASVALFQSPADTAAAPAPSTNAAPMFSFGSSSAPAPSESSAPATQKFNFTFGSDATPAFGATSTPQSKSGGFPSANPLVSNGLPNPLSGNSITATPLSARSIPGATQPGQPAAGNRLFSMPQKDMWPNTNEQANPFMSNASSNQTFSFGATPSPVPFGSQAISQPVQHVFGASAQPAQNMFGQSNNSQPTMFQPPAQNPAPMFGSQPQPAANPAPSMGMFGTPNAAPFGAPNPAPSFEAAAPPAVTFNFGSNQSAPTLFGFGQQAQQPVQSQMGQMQGAAFSGFGGAPSGAPVQFAMGSAPSNTAGRRVRKAFRRNPQR